MSAESCPKRNPNPYSGVDWEKWHRISGCTHLHCTDDAEFQLLLEQGLEFATLSNYHPSAPCYPLASARQGMFRNRQVGYTKDGVYHHEEVSFSSLIEGWKESLSPESRSLLPFPEEKPLFSHIPESLLEAPNAEHHSFSDATPMLHVTAPGTTFTSGHFDDRANQFGITAHGYAPGVGLPWRTAFAEILKTLVVADGGGIIINHPTWSHLRPDFLLQLLDFDSRVLGLEVYNGTSRKTYTDMSDDLWDLVLSTGRQCFGFCAVDHLKNGTWNGRIVILTPERTAEACLRALRQGHFYGIIRGSGARFESVSFDGRVLQARCNREMFFQLLSKTGVAANGSGREFRFEITEETRATHGFLRLTAHDFSTREKLFAQPFML